MLHETSLSDAHCPNISYKSVVELLAQRREDRANSSRRREVWQPTWSTPPQPRCTRTARNSREDRGPPSVAADDVDRVGSDGGGYI